MAGQGIEGLIEVLAEQQMMRGTGAAEVDGAGRLYVVFGHPLHAEAGGATGLDAVDALGRAAMSEAQAAVSWRPGVTAARTHSLEVRDGVLERLREMAGQTAIDEAGAIDGGEVVGDLGLRRRLAGELDDDSPEPTSEDADPIWGIVISSICASLEAVLHRHAAGLVEAIRRAEPEPGSILMAIESARAIPVRAVSPATISGLLDEAEALVREKSAA